MARGAAVGETGADGEVGVHIARAIADARSLALGPGELPLEELSPATDRAERIASKYEEGGAWSHDVAAPGTDLLCERLADPFVEDVGRLRAVDELGVRWGSDEQRPTDNQRELSLQAGSLIVL
jgi:hypothetical protein